MSALNKQQQNVVDAVLFLLLFFFFFFRSKQSARSALLFSLFSAPRVSSSAGASLEKMED
jgi:hypothetical protein